MASDNILDNQEALELDEQAEAAGGRRDYFLKRIIRLGYSEDDLERCWQLACDYRHEANRESRSIDDEMFGPEGSTDAQWK